MRLIDADVLLKKCSTHLEVIAGRGSGKSLISLAIKIAKEMIAETIKIMPTIEAKPVVHAHWTEGAPFHQCSNCNGFALSFDNEPYRKEILSNFCPHCGAQMDEEK